MSEDTLEGGDGECLQYARNEGMANPRLAHVDPGRILDRVLPPRNSRFMQGFEGEPDPDPELVHHLMTMHITPRPQVRFL